MTVIEHSGPTCNRCGVTYVPEGEGQTCGEPYCNGRVTWEATADRLASQLRAAVDRIAVLETALRWAHPPADRCPTRAARGECLACDALDRQGAVMPRCDQVCKLVGWRCQLPAGHDGEHFHETDQDRVTWTPRRMTQNPFLDDFQGRDPVHPVLPVVGAHTPVAVHPRSGAPVFLPQ